MSESLEQSQIGNRKSQILAWHGWRMVVPDSWNPVKVDGDWDQGMVLLADMQAAKLGVRWRRMKRGDPAKWAGRAMVSEVGKLAAEEARPFALAEPSAWRVSSLYTEPDPPGRDVWVGWSARTARVLEIVQHVKRRDSTLTETILPSLSDTPADQTQDWSIFDLSCRTPAGWTLQWYRLNAGDLSLSFRNRKRQNVMIRQVGPASLALVRMKLDGWLGQYDKSLRKVYRAIGGIGETAMDIHGRPVSGLRGVIRRKRRMFWAISFARELQAIALHDPQRNRLLIGQSDDETTMKQMLGSMGWVKEGSG